MKNTTIYSINENNGDSNKRIPYNDLYTLLKSLSLSPFAPFESKKRDKESEEDKERVCADNV